MACPLGERSSYWSEIDATFSKNTIAVQDLFSLRDPKDDRSERKPPSSISKTVQLQAYRTIFALCREGGFNAVVDCWKKLEHCYRDFCRQTRKELLPSLATGVAAKTGSSNEYLQKHFISLYFLVKRVTMMRALLSTQFLALSQQQVTVKGGYPTIKDLFRCIEEAEFKSTLVNLIDHLDTYPLLMAVASTNVLATSDGDVVEEGENVVPTRDSTLDALKLGLGAVRELLDLWGTCSVALERVNHKWTQTLGQVAAAEGERFAERFASETVELVPAAQRHLDTFATLTKNTLGAQRALTAILASRICFLRAIVSSAAPLVAGCLGPQSTPPTEGSLQSLRHLFLLFEEDSWCLQQLATAVGKQLAVELDSSVTFKPPVEADAGASLGDTADTTAVQTVIQIITRYRQHISQTHPDGVVAVFQVVNQVLAKFLAPQEHRVSFALAWIQHKWVKGTPQQLVEENQSNNSASSGFPHATLDLVSQLGDKDLFIRFSQNLLSTRLLGSWEPAASSIGNGASSGGAPSLTFSQEENESELLGSLTTLLGRAVVAPLCVLHQSFVGSLHPHDRQAESAGSSLHLDSRVLPSSLWTGLMRVGEATESPATSRSASQSDKKTSPREQATGSVIGGVAAFEGCFRSDAFPELYSPLQSSAVEAARRYHVQFPKRSLSWLLHAGFLTVECTQSAGANLKGLLVYCPPAAWPIFDALNSEAPSCETCSIATSKLLGRQSKVPTFLQSSLEATLTSLLKCGLLLRSDDDEGSSILTLSNDRPKKNGGKLRLIRALGGAGAASNAGTIAAQTAAGRQKERGTSNLKEHEKILEAAIVRILKARRTMPEKPDLEQCVIQQVRHHFLPTSRQVSATVASLADRDYLSIEDASNSSTGKRMVLYKA